MDDDGIIPFSELQPETDEEAIARLAAMTRMQYERVRAHEAERLGFRVSMLDRFVIQARPKLNGNGTEPKGHRIELYEPEPWPEPVDGATVLNDAYDTIARHMAIRPQHAVTAVLWAAHTHIYDEFAHTPRLGITAPEAECGKSLLLYHLVGSFVTRPQSVELMKPAPFFRLAEQYRPVFLIDEVDVFLKEDSDLLAAINNGWEPHGGVPRCVGDGANIEVRLFSTHTPVAMGGVKLEKLLPATTLSRTLMINLDRAIAGQIATPYEKALHRPGFLEIGRRIARWCRDNKERIHLCRPALPPKTGGRRADKWRPLFAIAELAGGSWPERVKGAFLAEDRETVAKLSTALQLLSDIREVMRSHEHVIATDELIDRLAKLDESPWCDYNFRERDGDRRRIQPRQVGGLLKDYGIRSKDIRLGAWKGKGYRRVDLEPIFERYIGDFIRDTATIQK